MHLRTALFFSTPLGFTPAFFQRINQETYALWNGLQIQKSGSRSLP